MKKYFLRLKAFTILTILFFAISCNGQTQTDPPLATSVSDLQAIPGKNSGIIKTQGTNEYQAINCSLQDKAGNLWFGTSGEGLYYYNGQVFTQMTKKDGLCSNSIFFMLEDKASHMWFGSREGLCQYDGKTFTNIPIPVSNGTNNPFYQPSSNKPNEKNELWSMMQDRSGKIWLGTTDGVYCYNGKSFIRFFDTHSILNKNNVTLKWTQCLFEDKNGNIWFGSWVLANEGICRYDGNAITQFKPYGEGWIRSIVEDKNGDLLFVTRHHGVCRFDGITFTNFTKDAGLNDGSITSVLEDKAGNLWFGTELGSGELNENGGLWRYNGKTFTRFTRKDGLCHNGVFCMVEDKAANIWVGTRNTGLCRYDGKTFTSFSE